MRAEGGDPPFPLREEEAEALIEYSYHQAVPGVSHEQYMETSRRHVRWMIGIHGAFKRVEGEKNKQG